MIKNAAAIVALAGLGGLVMLAGCQAREVGVEPFQGIVEFDERVLAFEIPGRLLRIAVDEGDELPAGAELARLDDTLERLGRDARAAEARAVRAELELIQAGSRPEDVRSLQAELSAAKSAETLAKQNVGRQRQLSKGGIGTAADLDAAESAIATATANRRDLEARLSRAKHGARSQEIDAATARADAADTAVRLAEERIARHVLHTDGPGTVLDVHVEPDEFAQVGLAIVTLGDVHHPYVDVFVPQARVGELELGTVLEVRTDANPDPLVGHVEHIARTTEFTPKFLFSETERPNLVIRVRVRVDAPEGNLQAGLPAFVTLGGAS
ncbi:MAG: HlyD family efflux transporter periplasmic adaptor subunit [Deltaproteobacteria bacterium]|nr:HlyD family efflux transporter periplasmic adaptor subunit [Deltaproteobacteria bacterium]